MALFGSGRPDVERLRGKNDVRGLIAAASYRDRRRLPDGTVVDDGVEVRVEALAALQPSGPDSFTEAALTALNDEAPEVRAAAVPLVAELGDPMGTGLLIDGLASWTDPAYGDARDAALEALTAIAAPDAARRFALALAVSREPELVRERDEAVLDALLAADFSSPAGARGAIATQVASKLADRGQPEPVRDRAASILLWLGPDAVSEVRVLMHDRAPEPRTIRLAGALAHPDLLADLVLLCEHHDPALRAAAAESVGAVGDPRGLAGLLRLTQDEAFVVRRAALTALDRFGVHRVLSGVAAGAASGQLEGAGPAGAAAGIGAGAWPVGQGGEEAGDGR